MDIGASTGVLAAEHLDGCDYSALCAQMAGSVPKRHEAQRALSAAKHSGDRLFERREDPLSRA